MKSTKRSLWTSALALFLCFAMLTGTTFAWFTDVVNSNSNVIQSGNLDAEMYWSDDLLAADSADWKNADGVPVFTYNNWEPGYTEVKYIKVKNAGNLSFKWQITIEPEGEVGKLAEVIDVYYVNPVENKLTNLNGLTSEGVLSDVIKSCKSTSGVLLPNGETSSEHAVYETIIAIAFHMQEDAGNEYQKESVGAGFSLKLLATQFGYENDAFGSEYDTEATFPEINKGQLEIVVPVDNGVVTTNTTVENDGREVTVLAGTKTTSSTLNLSVTEIENSQANVVLGENEEMKSLDVHVDGVAEDNTVPIIIDLGEVMPKGLNIGNYTLYHVENGANVAMRSVASVDALSAHNDFYYDPNTGEVTVAMATFSEVALVADTENAWEGKFDYTWYDASKTELTIANADQLAAFGAIVGGMKKVTDRVDGNYTYSEEVIQDSFFEKTVKLLADINLGDDEKNNKNLIFYPIGYYNSEGTYERTKTAITSGLRNFEGTFDGNGHTVSNFYHNTWEMKGDNNYYDATLQYYRDGMGLFGRVYGGTIKNLTVRNFSSDGEYTTTGVIAAYADFGATFENIAIFDCNPRVYNIGNGGIVGCVGWYTKGETDKKVTFKNITVDNSNKISALWGSYDVACGGIVGQYYPTSGQTSAGTPKNAGIDFVNCHVSAVMDVYNDVCANYQYYAYRYTGMLIGSVRENVTIDGKSYPKMDGITAKDCTVHFGDWNDYYYCELVANSLASYTHDHQMSRLTQVASVDVANKTVTDLEGKTTAIPTSGRVNYVVVKAKDENGMWIHGDGHDYAECYHFVNGVQHFHDVADADNPNPTETVNGVAGVLKEDKQLIYREFNQLFTGYGWGVTSKGVTDYEGVENMDISEGDHEASVEKFESKLEQNNLTNNIVYKLSDIFNFVNNGVELKPQALNVSITNLDENNPVSATVVYDRENWGNSTITLAGTGEITITIQDYYFCTPTTITVEITDRQPEVKFGVVMNNGDFLHRVGNIGTVALDKLFKAKDGVTVGTVSVTVEAVNGTSASGDYSDNAIQFNGTGVVKVTITDNDYCIPTELYLEVVDATNVTGLSGTLSGNVVLLNDCGISSLTVSGRNTVYGNGFTATYSGNGQYLHNGLKQGVITVSDNGTLDNLRVKATIYPKAFMYYGTTMLGDYVQHKDTPTFEGSNGTAYAYQLSAVVAKGNATIQNCYIYGGRTNVFVDTGNVTIKDSIFECGTVANVQIQSTAEYTVTLENVTTIQYQVSPTIGDTSKVMLGLGVLVGPDTTSNPTIVLNGDFKQYNWVTDDDANAVSDDLAKTIIKGALEETNFNHTINGKTASNLGIIYMNTNKVNVINNTGLPYDSGNVSISSADGQVYSLKKAAIDQIYSDYINADRSTVNGDYLPTFDFDLGEQEISYGGSEDTRYLYGGKNGLTALYQDGDDALTLDLTKLATIYKYDGINYTITATCKDSNGNILTANNGTVTLDAQGDYIIEFTVNDNIFYNKNGETISKSVERTYSVSLNLTVKEASVKNAVVNITKTALDGVYYTVNWDDYELRINFLDCISITDYDNKGTGTTVNLSSNIASATLTPSGVNVFTTASTITITYTDGRVLTVNLSNISGSSPGTKTAKVNTSGSVYFTTEGALNNKPTEASSQNKCTITSVSFKGNNGSTVTNDTDVTVTWALESSSGGGGGCVTPDTLITLADGTQKRIDEVNYEDKLLVWNFFKGEYAVVPSALIVNHGYGDQTIIKLEFEDGTVVKAITAHSFFDADTNKWELLDANNANEYIGHEFVKANGDGYATTKLVNVEVYEEYTESYSLVSAGHYNFITENMFSLTNSVHNMLAGLVVGENMTYDNETLNNDLAQYGEYTYADFADYITYEQYIAFNGDYLKISVEKGYITFEEILGLIKNYLE